MTAASISRSPSKRRWLQFSLRTLLIVTLIVAAACAWVGNRLRRDRCQEQVVEEWTQFGAQVGYDFEWEGLDKHPLAVFPLHFQLLRTPPAPKRLRSILGDDGVRRLGPVRLVAPAPASAIAFSPDGRLLAALSRDVRPHGDVVRVWDIATSRQVTSFVTKTAGTRAFTFAPDGKRLIVGSESWSPATNAQAASGLPEGALAVSPDGRYVAVLKSASQELSLWNLQKQVELWKVPFAALEGEGERPVRIVACQFTPDSQRVALLTRWGLLQIRSVTDAKLRFVVRLSSPYGDFDYDNGISFSPNGQRMAAGGGAHRFMVHDLTNGYYLAKLPDMRDHSGNSIAWSPDGAWIACCLGNERGVAVYDARDFHEAHRFAGVIGGRLTFSPDGKRLAVACIRALSEIRLWDTESWQELGDRSGPKSFLMRVAFSPDQSSLAASSATGEVYCWDLERGRIQWTSTGPPAGNLSYSADGWSLASIGYGGDYRLYHAIDGHTLLHRPASQERHGSHAVAITHSLDRLPLLYERRRVAIWNVAADELVAEPTLEGGRDAAFSPDGRLLAIVDEQMGNTKEGEPDLPVATDQQRRTNRVRFWDLLAGKLVAESYGCAEPKNESADRVNDVFTYGNLPPRASIHFSSSGSELVATAASGAIEVWDVSRRRLSYTIEGRGPYCLSPDGRYLAQVDRESLRLYELATGILCFQRAVSTPQELRDGGHVRSDTVDLPVSIFDVAMAPDGRTAATVSADQPSVLTWSLAPPNAAAPVDDAERQQLWNNLASDEAVSAHRAYIAIWKLASGGESTVQFLSGRMEPVRADSPAIRQVRRWIDELDSGEYRVRQQATDQLRRQGHAAEWPLRQALSNHPSLEKRTRIESLLKSTAEGRRRYAPQTLQYMRAIQVLEWINTAAARNVLGCVALGDALAPESAFARDALLRLKAKEPTNVAPK